MAMRSHPHRRTVPESSSCVAAPRLYLDNMPGVGSRGPERFHVLAGGTRPRFRVGRGVMKRSYVWVALLTGICAAIIGAWVRIERLKDPSPPVLSIFCFQGYTEPAWVKDFEEEHGCKIRITYTSTIEEMFARTSEAPEAFHLLSLDAGRVRMYTQAALLQPIDTTRLTNYDAIRAFFRTHPLSRGPDGAAMHVPFVWGTQTLTVNTKRLPEGVLKKHLGPDGRSVSLDILTDPRLKGHTAFFDEAANVFAVAAIHEGVDDPHELSTEQLGRVEKRIRSWMTNAAEFTTGIYAELNALASGRVWVLLGGNDAFLNVRLAQAGIADNFAQYPATEGTYCWIDGWVITRPTRGRALALAYRYIDRLIGLEGQRQLVQTIGFGPVTEDDSLVIPEVLRRSTPWYAAPIDSFPTPLVIMAPEEAPLRRVEKWQALKAAYTDGAQP